MYPVSEAYSTQMRMPVREAQAHATVFLGVFDRTASQDAAGDFPETVIYSQPNTIIHSPNINMSYATYEGCGFRLDGVQALLPDNLVGQAVQGFIGAELSDADGAYAGGQSIVIHFGDYHDMIGLTLQFDPHFPTPKKLTVTGYADGVQTSSLTLLEPIEVFTRANIHLDAVNKIVIDFESVVPYGRARLNGIGFGIGYTYTDSQIISITEKHQGSPVSVSLPSSSFEFTLHNENNIFGVGNDSELSRFLVEGQQASVDYAVTWAGGGTQEIPSGLWFLKSWTVDRLTAAFKMENALEPLINSKFIKGIYDETSRTLFQLAETVLSDAGVEFYYIDPYLQTITTAAPLPVVSHAEALQLIANAGLAKLYVDREGRICLESTVESIPTVSSPSTQTPYSDPTSTLLAGNSEYMTFEKGFARVDATQLLLPDSGETLSSGWVVDALAADGKYPDNEITLHYTAPTNVFSLTIDWGGKTPESAKVSSLVDGIWQKPVTLYPTAQRETYSVAFRHCTDIKIQLENAGNDDVRPRILYINTSKLSNFNLQKPQVFETSKETMEVKLKNVKTYWTHRTTQKTESEIFRQRVNTNAGVIEISHNLAANISAKVEKDGIAAEGITILAEHYAYISRVSLASTDAQEVELVLTGRAVHESEISVSSTANENGEDQEIRNPLFDSSEIAQNTADWVRNHYSRRVVYDYNIRGFPELEYGDTIYLDEHPAVITNLELTYNGAFNSSVRLRG